VIRARIEPMTAEAFAPFGLLLPPGAPGERPLALIEELQNGRASARPRLSMTTVEPKALPLTVAKMERHVHSSQAFAPMDCASYLVMVAASDRRWKTRPLAPARSPRAGRYGDQLSRWRLAPSAVAARARGPLRHPHLHRRNRGRRGMGRPAAAGRGRPIGAARSRRSVDAERVYSAATLRSGSRDLEERAREARSNPRRSDLTAEVECNC
jgi:hypothetical protein